MSRIHFSAILLALLACARAGAQTNAPLTETTFAKVDEIAKAWVQSGKTAGLAVGIAQRGKIVFARGYGFADLEDRVPVTPDTVFRVGSIQKQFTAAAVLLLAEQGKLSLDDPLNKFFPDFPQGERVTIRELLSHTSGIHDVADADPRQMRLNLSPEEVRNLIKAHNPLYDFPPGTAFHYSNSGYILAGMIAEKVSGQSLREFLQNNVFSKLGLTSTAIDNDTDVVPHRARGYDRDSAHPDSFKRAEFVSMHVFRWSGGLRTTVRELLQWQDALLAGHVIGPDLLRQMTSPAHVLDGRSTNEAVWPPGKQDRGDYGYGFYFLNLFGHPQIIHGGDVNGFEAVASTSVDDHISFVVMCNTSGGLAADKQLDVWLQIAQTLLPTREAPKK